MVEPDLIETAKTVMAKAAEKGVKLLLPFDCVIAEELKGGVPTRTVSADAIPEGWMGLDIGPDTIAAFGRAIGEARTIVWNGPMGVFEVEEFSKGTFEISDFIARSGAMSVVGGGDSVAALKKSGNQDKVTFVSTAGLAMPSFYIGSILLLAAFFYALRTGGGGPIRLTGYAWDLHLLLPTLALMARPTVQIMQMTSGLLEVELGKRYIRTARSVGHLWQTVRRKHALRNILAPVVLVIAGSARMLMS